MNALTTVDNNPGTSFILNFSQSVTVGTATILPAINSNSSITINGNNNTLDGGGVQRGLFAFSGTVSLSNLTIQNTSATGGAGGGGAGLGGSDNHAFTAGVRATW